MSYTLRGKELENPGSRKFGFHRAKTDQKVLQIATSVEEAIAISSISSSAGLAKLRLKNRAFDGSVLEKRS